MQNHLQVFRKMQSYISRNIHGFTFEGQLKAFSFCFFFCNMKQIFKFLTKEFMASLKVALTQCISPFGVLPFLSVDVGNGATMSPVLYNDTKMFQFEGMSGTTTPTNVEHV